MEISEVFYLSGIIFFIFFSALTAFLVFQLYIAMKGLRAGLKTAKRTVVAFGAARFALKSALLRTIISFLEGGEKNKRDEQY